MGKQKQKRDELEIKRLQADLKKIEESKTMENQEKKTETLETKPAETKSSYFHYCCVF